MDTFSEKVVLVTGASSGLGREIATAFADAGARVVLAARGKEMLEEAAAALRAKGADVLAVPTDLTKPADVQALVERAVAWHGRLDVLVNNAGRSARGALLDTTAEQFGEMIDLNVLALVRISRAALPHLLETRGHVVNIGSLAAKSAGRWLGAYPASKFAVAAYSQQLRLELEPRGLHVLLVCPGPLARRDPQGTAVAHAPRYETAGLPAEASRPGGGVKTRQIDPVQLARDIVAACKRRSPELIRPRKARLLFVLNQLSPRLGDWLVRRMT